MFDRPLLLLLLTLFVKSHGEDIENTDKIDTTDERAFVYG